MMTWAFKIRRDINCIVESVLTMRMYVYTHSLTHSLFLCLLHSFILSFSLCISIYLSNCPNFHPKSHPSIRVHLPSVLNKQSTTLSPPTRTLINLLHEHLSRSKQMKNCTKSVEACVLGAGGRIMWELSQCPLLHVQHETRIKLSCFLFPNLTANTSPHTLLMFP